MTANNEHRFGPAFTNELDLSDDATFHLIGDIPNSETLLGPFELDDEEFKTRMLAEVIATGRVNDSDLSTLLDPPDTTSPNCDKHGYRGRFMRGKEEEYAATIEAYRALAEGPSDNHVSALSHCREYASFKREDSSGEVKVFASSCHDRWCPMCAGQKASFAKEQTQMYIESLKAPRFLTLTLRNNTNDLKTQIEFLTESFRTLRQRAFWKKRVTGGIWFLQVKRGKNSGCWHPHLHMLIDGSSLEQARLSELWEQVTFGSPVIDIRRVHDIEEVAKYVARYCARPAMLKNMPLIDRVEVISSLFRKRLSGTFGTGKTVTLTPPKIKAEGEWAEIGYYDEVMKEAKTNPKAKAILRAYFNDEVLTEKQFESYTGRPVHAPVIDCGLRAEIQPYLDFY